MARELRGTEIAGDLAVRSIDELPILAVLAARARGTTVVRDAEELRVKESDRIATTCAMLRVFGINCEVRPDGFTVEGRPDGPLEPGNVHADGDHRIAMAAAVAGLAATRHDAHRRCRQRRDLVSRLCRRAPSLGATIRSEG